MLRPSSFSLKTICWRGLCFFHHDGFNHNNLQPRKSTRCCTNLGLLAQYPHRHVVTQQKSHSHSRMPPFLVPGEASSKDVINVLRHLQKLKEIRTAAGEKAYVCLTA
jgi:hypothetical protein